MSSVAASYLGDSRKKHQRIKAPRKKIEFMKLIIAAVMITYFWGVLLGSYVVIRILIEQPQYAVEALVALFSFIGLPTGTAIGFYAWKARAENQIKLKKEHEIPFEQEDFNYD